MGYSSLGPWWVTVHGVTKISSFEEDNFGAKSSSKQKKRTIVPPTSLGKNTVVAVQSGIVLGYKGLVEGLVKQMKDPL